jgi:hypothetical protein
MKVAKQEKLSWATTTGIERRAFLRSVPAEQARTDADWKRDK